MATDPEVIMSSLSLVSGQAPRAICKNSWALWPWAFPRVADGRVGVVTCARVRLAKRLCRLQAGVNRSIKRTRESAMACNKYPYPSPFTALRALDAIVAVGEPGQAFRPGLPVRALPPQAPDLQESRRQEAPGVGTSPGLAARAVNDPSRLCLLVPTSNVLPVDGGPKLVIKRHDSPGSK